ncbi:NepR family anti-sigma factor [Rhodoblastus sphagnicola]|uniref:NepR family anti-sigma factor n=1 Tax=Rhodoblastus sphagnicola TaxID=333368 RepID=UPI001FCECB4C|nr:NepR family anti-sigma factor [Rhodoblastus sphagnicola]
MESKQEPPASPPPLNEKLRLHLGDRLKLLFAETEMTAIPDRFASLLDQLEQAGVEGVDAPGAVRGQRTHDASEVQP